ncbi:MAG: hypothetical protein R2752_08125 [Vicinamibacterales bacterium]
MTAMPGGSPRARRLAVRVLHGYPRRWRARYGTEMRALLDEMPVTWRQVADLGAGAVREWLSPRVFGWPARSAAGRVQTARALKFFGVAYALDVAIYLLFSRETTPDAGWTAVLDPAATVLMAAFTARMVVGILAWRRRPRWLGRQRWLARLGSAEIAFWFVALAVRTAHDRIEPIPDYLRNPAAHVLFTHVNVFVQAHILFICSSLTRRLNRVAISSVKRGGRGFLFKLPGRND